jgi:hypothetical protein
MVRGVPERLFPREKIEQSTSLDFAFRDFSQKSASSPLTD